MHSPYRTAVSEAQRAGDRPISGQSPASFYIFCSGLLGAPDHRVLQLPGQIAEVFAVPADAHDQVPVPLRLPLLCMVYWTCIPPRRTKAPPPVLPRPWPPSAADPHNSLPRRRCGPEAQLRLRSRPIPSLRKSPCHLGRGMIQFSCTAGYMLSEIRKRPVCNENGRSPPRFRC